MKSFVVRDDSGFILRTGSCADSLIAAQAGVGEFVDENTGNWNDVDHYFDGETYTAKTSIPFVFDGLPIDADGVDLASVSGLPVGTQVRYPTEAGDSFSVAVVDDGVFDFAIDIVGSFDLLLSHPLYLDAVVEVVAE